MLRYNDTLTYMYLVWYHFWWYYARYLVFHNERYGVLHHRHLDHLAFVRGIQQWPVNSSLKEQLTRKMFPFDDVITMTSMVVSHRVVRMKYEYELTTCHLYVGPFCTYFCKFVCKFDRKETSFSSLCKYTLLVIIEIYPFLWNSTWI